MPWTAGFHGIFLLAGLRPADRRSIIRLYEAFNAYSGLVKEQILPHNGWFCSVGYVL